MRQNRVGLALFELVLVFAIVGILAIVAIGRYDRSLTRSKVSQVRSDFRSVAQALESYQVDHGVYPYDGYNAPPGLNYSYWFLPFVLSTPVAYLPTSNLRDPFRKVSDQLPSNFYNYRYTNVDSTWGDLYDAWIGSAPTISIYYDDMLFEIGRYRILSAGPDSMFGPSGWYGLSTYPPFSYPATALPLPYDPTNGINSNGDLLRFESCPTGYRNAGTF